MRGKAGSALVLAASLVAGAVTGTDAGAAGTLPITAGHLAPRDECRSLPGAAAFRAALAAAVRRRDAGAMARLSASDIKLDFGGTTSPRAFEQLLRGAEGAALWRELDVLLTLGCAVQDGDLVLPWLFAQDIGENEDFDRVVVAGANVPLRAGPAPGARTLRLLSWVLVRQLDPASETPPRFTRVRLDGGNVTGYIETASLRSQIGYRLSARREAKSWKIDYFLAGD